MKVRIKKYTFVHMYIHVQRNPIQYVRIQTARLNQLTLGSSADIPKVWR